MRSCPFCLAMNYDDASVCYNCGQAFFYGSAPLADTHTQPTQPVNVRLTGAQRPYERDDAYDAPLPDWQPAPSLPKIKEERPPWPLLLAGLSLLLILAFAMAIFTGFAATQKIGRQIFSQSGATPAGNGANLPTRSASGS